jgi:hypothetical protein
MNPVSRVTVAAIGWLARVVRALDDRLRFLDLAVNRTSGGILHRWTERHTIAAVVFPAALVFFLVNGPAIRPSWRLLAAVIAAAASAPVFVTSLSWTARGGSVHRDLLAQSAVLMIIAGAIWIIAGPDTVERSPTLVYRHVLIPTTVLLVIAALLAAALADRLFRSSRARGTVPPRLEVVELFVTRPAAQQLTGAMFLLAAFRAVTSTPARVLFPPALVVLFVDREWVMWVFAAVALVNLVLLSFAALDMRFSASWQLLHGIFFGQWAAVISTLVILLGIARIADVQYVSTVFDGARGFTIAGYVIAAYVLVWWHDYWTATGATVRFLDVLGGAGSGSRGSIQYAIQPAHVRTSVPADRRVIQIHGAGRLLVLRDDGRSRYFHGYKPEDLADALADDLPPRDPGRPDIDWLKWRLNSHFLITSALIVVLLGGTGWLLHQLPQQPGIGPPAQTRRVPPVAVSSVLFPAETCTGEMPVIVIAASGGGTRAALYTASILERLYREGQLGSVRLVSGISGGGAALAYFVAHRAELLGPDNGAWNAFFSAMKEPYIADVIDGSGEWRMAQGWRLGHLLTESFDRRWGAGRKTMGAVSDIGLMLNSSVAGRFVVVEPNPDGATLGVLEQRAKEGLTAAGKDRDGAGAIPLNAALSDVAGGRVVYTNLDIPDHFAGPTLIENDPMRERNDTRLPVYIVNGEDVSLAAAAAANANFPPVFSNAAVDRDAKTRFWITDGGAVDNRGTETLLLAVRYALTHGADLCARLPPLHVVEIEASAFSDGYRQDRGIGSMMSAGTAFASQLDAELIADIRDLYDRRSAQGAQSVRFHFLPMPALLRRSGSFGTHWMLQSSITVCEDPACSESMVLKGDEVVDVLRALGRERLPSDDTSSADEAQRFIESEDRELGPNWNRLTACLRAGPAGC